MAPVGHRRAGFSLAIVHFGTALDRTRIRARLQSCCFASPLATTAMKTKNFVLGGAGPRPAAASQAALCFRGCRG
jgi:hypothetical protein